MRSTSIIMIAAALFSLGWQVALAQKGPPAPGQKAPPASSQKGLPAPSGAKAVPKAAVSIGAEEQDEKAIRLAADAFTKAYNAHDAKAIANLFTADADVTNEDGDIKHGRAEIEKEFATVFVAAPQAQIAIAIQSIRFLSAGTAVEEGSATVSGQPDREPDTTDYSVVHVKQGGRWLMASVRDFPAEPTAEEELNRLEWLVGEWVDESPEGLVLNSYHWADNHRYLLSEFTIQVAGHPVMKGSQRIGWDPLAKVLRSWVFDSEGGFAGGVYTRDGDRWIIKMTGVTHDGKPASATNVITRVDKDRMMWQSRDRMVGDEAMSDIDEVPVVRKPPKPKN